MKVYLVTTEMNWNFEQMELQVEVFTDLEKAKEYFNKIVKEEKEEYKNEYEENDYQIDDNKYNDKTYKFEIYLKGDSLKSHTYINL